MKTSFCSLQIFITGLVIIVSSCGSGPEFSGSARTPAADSTEKYQQEFNATDFENVQVGLNLNSRFTTQRVQMKEDPAKTVTTKQVDRPNRDIDQRQGHTGGNDNMTFKVSEAGKVDVIVVIDNSGSMKDYNSGMANQIQKLIDKLANTNWQIGVISTDPNAFDTGVILSNGQRLKEDASCVTDPFLIKKTDTNAKEKFVAAMNRRGSADPQLRNVEHPFSHVLQAIGAEAEEVGHCPTPVKWMRNDAALAVLFLSDEDDCGTIYPDGHSDTEQSTCNKYYKRNDYFKGSNSKYFLDELSKTRSLTGTYPVRMYGMIVDPDANQYPITSCSPIDAAHGIRLDGVIHPYSCELKRAINSTTGLSANIYKTDQYDKVLEQIGNDISKLVTREFTLDHEPDNLALELKVGNDQTQTLITSGFTISGTKLILDPQYVANEKLFIKYSYGNKPKFKEIALNAKPDLDTLVVTIDGQITQTHVYQDDKKSLAFEPAPPEDSIVHVHFREMTQKLISEFDLGSKDIIQSTLTVTIDGQPAEQYRVQDNKLDFLVAPKDGQTIEAKFKTESGKITQYARGFEDQRKAKQIWAIVEDTKEPLNVQDQNGTLVFDQKDIVDGRSIVVAWDFGEKTKDHSITLRGNPMKNTLKISSDRSDIDCMQNIAVQDTTLNFNCSSSDVNAITISYGLLKSHTNRFVLGAGIPTGPDTYWRVYVNDKETSKFKRNGSTVEIDPSEVPEQAKVKVHVFKTTTATNLASSKSAS